MKQKDLTNLFFVAVALVVVVGTVLMLTSIKSTGQAILAKCPTCTPTCPTGQACRAPPTPCATCPTCPTTTCTTGSGATGETGGSGATGETGSTGSAGSNYAGYCSDKIDVGPGTVGNACSPLTIQTEGDCCGINAGACVWHNADGSLRQCSTAVAGSGSGSGGSCAVAGACGAVGSTGSTGLPGSGSETGSAGSGLGDSWVCTDTGGSGSWDPSYGGQAACHPTSACWTATVPGTAPAGTLNLQDQKTVCAPFTTQATCEANSGCGWGALHWHCSEPKAPAWCDGATCHPIKNCEGKTLDGYANYYETVCTAKKQTSPVSDANMKAICTGPCHYAVPGTGDTDAVCPARTNCAFTGAVGSIPGSTKTVCAVPFDNAGLNVWTDDGWRAYCASDKCKTSSGACSTGNECCGPCSSN